MLRQQGAAAAEPRHADAATVEEFRAEAAREGVVLLVNYHMPTLGQGSAFGGHVSPLGAYDEVTDSVLLLDVWVTITHLFLPVRIALLWGVDLLALISGDDVRR